MNDPRDLIGKCASTATRIMLAFSRYGFTTRWIDSSIRRGVLNESTREIDPFRASTWEMSAFSQNGEDGIIDYLTSRIAEPNRYFIEIGASDGLENNTTYLALVKRYGGIMVEGSHFHSWFARRVLGPRCSGVNFLNSMVTAENVAELVERSRHSDPDFASVDIDGIDYYVTESLLENGLRPKVFCVEYNSAFGPEKSLTVPYSSDFDYGRAHPTRLYYGVSLTGWKNFFARYGYEFVTTDSNGVNAFFIDPGAVELHPGPDFKGGEFRENGAQWVGFGCCWEGQFRLIEDQQFVEISRMADGESPSPA